MKRFQSVSRVALVGAATAALLLGGVGPAFAVGNEGEAAEVELTTDAQPEIVTPEEGGEGSADADSSPEVDAAIESAEQGEVPAAVVPEEADVVESDDEFTYTEFSGGSESTPNESVEAAGAGVAANTPANLRKISGKISIPAGAPKAWLKALKAGADCVGPQSGGGCGWETKINTSTGEYSMKVPKGGNGQTVIPGVYVSTYSAKGEVINKSVNLVQQSWGQTCGVGKTKSLPAGSSNLTGISLSMCLGATIKGTITDPKRINPAGTYSQVWAFADAGLTNAKSSAMVDENGQYALLRVPRVKTATVTYRGHYALAAEEAWKGTFDAKKASKIDTTSGATVTGIDFIVKPGFADMCLTNAYCNKFYKEIMWMHDAGISTGTKVQAWDGTTYKNYQPKQAVTREAMSAFLYRISDRTGYKASATPRFVDVKKNHKFYAQIQWMGDMGISTGTVRNGKRYYDPSQGVTREAMSAFLYRMDKGAGPALTKTPRFVDVKKNHKFYTQIQWMGDTGISTGTTRNGKAYYDPSAKVTREAMSAFLYRFDN